MLENNDWRLTNQQKYLTGATLHWRTWHRPKHNPEWDHDHCEFCWAKFMEEDFPNVLHAGYTTADEYRWICQTCFDDFKEMFHFILG